MVWDSAKGAGVDWEKLKLEGVPTIGLHSPLSAPIIGGHICRHVKPMNMK